MNLFVYGSLRRPARNRYAKALHRGSAFLGEAKVQARLYRHGRYPAMVRSKNAGDWVTGQIHRLRNPEEQLAFLDEYEGTGYLRTMVRAFAPSGKVFRCWTYLSKACPRRLSSTREYRPHPAPCTR